MCWVEEAVCLFSDLATRCSVGRYKEHTGAYEVEYAQVEQKYILFQFHTNCTKCTNHKHNKRSLTEWNVVNGKHVLGMCWALH